MTVTTPYILSLIGLVGLAFVALYRGDALLMAFAVLVAVMAVSALAWEARAE